jgi:addiction module RelE/StbE family toxin
MREYDVIWTEEAVKDLEDIARYIAKDSPGNARRVMKRLRASAESLWSFPERGRIVPELGDLGLRHWRELLVKPHRLIYKLSENRVIVEVVLDSRRDAASLLADRLLRR